MSNKPYKGFWSTTAGRYVFNNLIAFDQWLNAKGGGDPQETVSSRIGKIKAGHNGKIPIRHFPAWLIDPILEKIDPGHSIDAIQHDQGSDAVIPDHPYFPDKN